METWSWEWGNISYGVNWDGLANELQGKERKRQGDNNNTQKEPTPGAKHLGTLKKNRKKKEKKERTAGLESQHPEATPPPSPTVSHEI